MNQRIMIIGSGGREHALAWKIAQSPKVAAVYVAPGNGGTTDVAVNVPLAVSDHAAILHFAKSEQIDLVVVAPDDALAAGLVDDLTAAGIAAFGPTRAAAQIEASKAFAKELMTAAGVPTAGFATFTDRTAAERYVAGRRFPQVVKASGLALGKGVYICADLAAAKQALADIMTDGVHGQGNCTCPRLAPTNFS